MDLYENRDLIVLNKYKLLELLNEDNIVQTYKAISYGVEGFEKILVAKKVRSIHNNNIEYITTFLKEANNALKLNHANIVQTIDVSEWEGNYYLIAEYINGVNLKEIIGKDEKLPIELTLYIISELAKGLDYAHRCKDSQFNQLNIIHTKLTPLSIYLSFEGDVKITDFGLAKAALSIIRNNYSLYQDNVIYMAPEILRDDIYDKTVDIYSLGVIFYELLAGINPFIANNDSNIQTLIEEGIYPPIKSLNKDIPDELSAIVEKSMNSSIELRYENSGDLYEKILEFLYANRIRVGMKELSSFIKEKKKPRLIIVDEDKIDQVFLSADEQPIKSEVTKVQIPIKTIKTDRSLEQLTAERRDVTAFSIETINGKIPEEEKESIFNIIDNHGGIVVEDTEKTLIALFGFLRIDGKDIEESLRCSIQVNEKLFKLRNTNSECSDLVLGFGIHPIKLTVFNDGGIQEDKDYYSMLSIVKELAQSSNWGIAVSYPAYFFCKDHFEFKFDGNYYLIREKPILEVYGKFINRKEQLKDIGIILKEAIDGEGRVVGVVGEAGMGKTRFLYEMEQRLKNRKYGIEFFWYQVKCSLQKKNQSLSGIADIVQKIIGIETESTYEELINKINRLGQLGLSFEEREILGELLGLYEGEIITEISKVHHLKNAITKMICKLAEDRLTIVVFDNADNLDKESLSVLNTVINSISNSNVVIILTYHPTYIPPWAVLSHFREIKLDHMSDEDCIKLIHILLKAHKLSKKLINDVLEKAAGNPMFIEEYLKALEEAGAIIIDWNNINYNEQMTKVGIPRNLRGVIGSRVDMLDSNLKGAVQRAAVIGTKFSIKLFADIVGVSENKAQLLAKELVKRGIFTSIGQDYTFTHDLLREVVYQSITFNDRKELHNLVAESLYKFFSDRIEEIYDSLAIHYRESGQKEKAIDYFIMAANRYTKIYMYETALQNYLIAIDLLQHSRQSDQSQILGLYSKACEMALSSDKISLGITKVKLAIELAEELGTQNDVVSFLVLAGRLMIRGGKFEDAKSYLNRALELYETVNDIALKRDILGTMGETLTRNGQFPEAVKYLDQAIKLSRDTKDSKKEAYYLRQITHCYAARGDRENALINIDKAEEVTRDLNEQFLLCETLKTRALAYFFLRDLTGSLKSSLRALELAKEYGFHYEIAVNDHNIGEIYIRLGQYQKAFAHLKISYEIARKYDFPKLESLNLMLLGFIDAVSFNSQEGIDRIKKSLEFAQRNNYKWDEIQIKYFIGLAHFINQNIEKSKPYLQDALQLARTNDNKIYVDDCESLLFQISEIEKNKDISEESTATTSLSDNNKNKD